MADLVHLPAMSSPADVAEALLEHGVVVVDRLLDAELLARFNAELDPLVADASPSTITAFINPAIAWFFGARTRHVTGIAGKSPVFGAEVLPQPTLSGVCDAVLGPELRALPAQHRARARSRAGHRAAALAPRRAGRGCTCRSRIPRCRWRR